MGGFERAEKVRLWRYGLPLTGSVSLDRARRISSREGLIVEAIRDGEPHFGEAAPLPGFSRETLAEAEEQLFHLIEAAPDLDLSSGSVFRGNLLPSVDFALWSVFASMRGEPLSDVPLCGLLSGEQDAVVSGAARLSRAGYRTLKVKVGRRSVAEDAGTVHRVAASTDGDVKLRLDANRAWSMSEAVGFASLTESVAGRVEFIEEPLREAAPDALKTLSEETGMPVALDESLVGLEPGELDGERYSFARAVVLKPQVLGASKGFGIARRAALFGADVVVSASYESGVGTLGLLRFARECAAGEPPAAGVDTYRRLLEDVLEARLDLSGPVFEAARTPLRLRRSNLERLL